MSRVFLLLLACALAAPALAQSTPPALPTLVELKAQLASGKQIVVSRALGLTSAEEADFWPAFDELQAGLAGVEAKRREARAAIAAGGRAAADGVESLVEADLEHAELLERAWLRLRVAVRPEKLARYLELERRIAATAML